MKILRLDKDKVIEENIIKHVRHLRLKKKTKTNDNIINVTRDLFKLKKEDKLIKDRLIRDIRNLLNMKEKIIINQ